MRASQCKTLSSTFVITAVILVFCLTATSRALAQKGDQVTQDAESRQVPEDRGSGGDTNSAEHQFSLNEDQLEFLLLVVALAAYLRLRIEWSKKLVNRRHRWLVSLMLLVELLIAAVGFMLVCRIFSKPLDRTPSAWLDRWILGLFVVSVGGFAVLLVVQLVFDVYWMCNGGRVPSGFLDVEAQTNGKTRRMKIRFADIVTMTEGDDNKLTVLKLKPVVEITVNKSWAQWKRTREFER